MKESIILFLMSLLATCTIPGGIGGDDGSIDVGQDTIPIINNGVHRIIKSGDTLTYRGAIVETGVWPNPDLKA